ncbi:MAG: CDP-alcohol phosphatidyltransferase family protein [Rhodothermales bacterium]
MPESKAVHQPAYKVLGKFWTLANMLSLARVVLVVPITYLIIKDGSVAWILGLVFAALCTDWFDGTVARWSKTVSEWGKVLDPLADKIAAISVVCALAVRGSLPIWFLLLILVRDILIVWGSTLATRKLQRVLMSLWWGKVAVFMLALTVLGAILKADPPILNISIWISSFLFVFSFFLYAYRYFQLMKDNGASEEDPESDNSNSELAYPVETSV